MGKRKMQDKEKDLDRACELTDQIFDKIAELKEIYPTVGEEIEKMFIQRLKDKFENDL